MIGLQNERQRNQEYSEERKVVNSRMSINIKRTLKNVIAIAAIANIVAMMVFQYGLPSIAAERNGSNSKEYSSEESGMGTIESSKRKLLPKKKKRHRHSLHGKRNLMSPKNLKKSGILKHQYWS